MRHKSITLAVNIFLLGLFLSPLSAWPQTLDDVDIETRNGDAVLSARFSGAVRYQKHFPLTRGKLLVISLRLVGLTDRQKEPSRRRISKQPKLNGKLPLLDVSFEPNGVDGPRLFVSFTRPVEYKVRQGRDNRSIDIILPGLGKGVVGSQRKPLVSAGSAPYVVDLMSQSQPITKAPLLPKALKKYRLYSYRVVSNGKRRYRLRLGFFASREEAERARRLLKARYPQAWVGVAGPKERAASSKTILKSVVPKAPRPSPKIAVAPELERKLKRLMEEGRQALVGGAYVTAIRKFSEILKAPESNYTQDARELIGLARERNGQLRLARVQYKLYLKLYPEDEGAVRVRQRLANLTRSGKPAALRAAKRKKPKKLTQVYGTLSQYYFNGNSKIDTSLMTGPTVVEQPTLSQTDQSSLISTLDLTARHRSERYDNRANFSGDYNYDYLEEEDGEEGESRVRSAYVGVSDKQYRYSIKVGRQSAYGNGVLGRYDGVIAGYNFLPKWGVSLVGGEPVDSIAPKSKRSFSGFSLDMGTFAGSWSTSLYYITQEIDGLVDRQAVGTELRYFDTNRSLFGLVDYDTYFDALNIFMVQGNWQYNGTAYNALVDYRKNPPLQLSNALLGESIDPFGDPIESVDDMLKTGSEEELKMLAEDRTLDSRMISASAVHTLNSRLQIGGDLIVSNFSGTETTTTQAGAILQETDGTGDVYTYSLKLIGSNVLFKRDLAVVGLAYTEGDLLDVRSAYITHRVSTPKHWRIDTGLRWYHQENLDSDSETTRLTPTIKIDYRSKRVTFELEVGQEQSEGSGVTQDQEVTRNYYVVGYRWDF